MTGSSWEDIEAIMNFEVSDTTPRSRRNEWIDAARRCVVVIDLSSVWSGKGRFRALLRTTRCCVGHRKTRTHQHKRELRSSPQHGHFRSSSPPSDTIGISPGQSVLAPGVSGAGRLLVRPDRAVTWGFVGCRRCGPSGFRPLGRSGVFPGQRGCPTVGVSFASGFANGKGLAAGLVDCRVSRQRPGELFDCIGIGSGARRVDRLGQVVRRAGG